MTSFKTYFQQQSSDCGATCLQMIANHYGKYYEQVWLDEICDTDRSGSNLLSLAEAAEKIGFSTLAVRCNWDFLLNQPPCILHWQGRHFVVLYKIKKQKAYIADPLEGKKIYSRRDFLKSFAINEDQGVALILHPSEKFFQAEEQSFHTTKHDSYRFLYGNRKLFIKALICLIVLALVQFTFPFITRAIVDEGIASEDIHFIYMMACAYGILYVSQLLSSLLRNAFIIRIGHHINLSLVSDYLSRLMSLPVGEFEKRQIRDYLQRYHESQKVRNFFSTSLVDAFYAVTMLLVLGLVLFIYSSGVLLIFSLSFLVYTGYILLFMKKLQRLENLNFRQSSFAYSEVQQIVTALPEISINVSQQRRRWSWEVKQRAQFETERAIHHTEELQLVGASFINEFKNIFIIAFCAFSVIKGEMTVGSMLAIQFVLGQLTLPMHQLVHIFREGLEARISLKRLQDIKNDQTPVPPTQFQGFSAGDIEIRQLSFSYRKGGLPILDQLSLHLPANKIIAIAGPSGSGKTTLLKLLLKFYQAPAGSILIGGQDINQINHQQWYSQCGVVMQDGCIFDDTLRSNITESQSNTAFNEELFLQAVKLARVEEFALRLPYGYHTPIGANGVALSGGQRQRVLLARALYKNPAYLFLDEATSALDARNEQDILCNLKSYAKQRTVIIIAHRLSTIQVADKILVLNQGKLEETGSHLQLTDKKGFYYQLVNEQLSLK